MGVREQRTIVFFDQLVFDMVQLHLLSPVQSSSALRSPDQVEVISYYGSVEVRLSQETGIVDHRWLSVGVSP